MRLVLLLIISAAFALTTSPFLPAQEATPASPAASRGAHTAESPLPPLLQKRPPRKPIPLPWKIAIVLGSLTICAVILALGARAWHSWNLFDRQYRFTTKSPAARRLGAARSGGCMAVLEFGRGSDGKDA